MKIFRTVAITLSLLLSNISTSAHEDGSEECFTGPNIPGKEHQPTPDGALSEANISVMINGVTLDSSSVSVLDASVSNEVTIAIDGNVYYGFYAYFSGDMDGSDALSVLASDMSGQVKAGNAWEAKNGKKSVQCDVGVSVAQHTTMDVKTMNDFGMQVASGGNAVLEVIVMTDWIFGRYYYTAFSLEFEGADDDLLTTDSPTAKPSSSPVVAATSNPTAKPSSSPVVAATSNPTAKPSSSPVVAATATPTASPFTSGTTESPTAKPSFSPVVAATSNPTAKPSSSPVVAATSNPTAKPSSSPVVAATPSPTDKPNSSPTAKPSSSPVIAATSNPTAKPSSSPVVASVLNPTSSPITTPTSTSPVVSTVDNPVATSAALPQNIVLPFGVLVLSAMFMLM